MRKIRDILKEKQSSSFEKYLYLTVGKKSIISFLVYELVSIFILPFPGAIGTFLRRIIVSKLFSECGDNVIIGRNCVFRHPGKIHLGANVVIDDNCLLDARGTQENGLMLGDHVMVNRNCVIQSKGGDIIIEKGVSVGGNSQLISWSGIHIGEGAGLAGGCYISAGTYELSNLDKPFEDRQAISKGPISIGKYVWIATRVTILDGVKVEEGSMISSGSVVTSHVKPNSVVHGNPAKLIYQFKTEE